jgi:hypothetical protein
MRECKEVIALLEPLVIKVRKDVAKKTAEEEPRPDRKHRRRRLRKQFWRQLQPFQKIRCRLEKAIENATRRKEDLLASFKKTVEQEKTFEQACNTTYAR